jgi:hypothetical protein
MPAFTRLPTDDEKFFGFSMYRVFIENKHQNRFFDLLEGIRSEESKIWLVEPGSFTGKYDIVVTDEELAFLKLSIPDMSVVWLQDWLNDKK